MFLCPRQELEVSVSFKLRLLYSRERAPSTHWMGDFVGPRADLDDIEEWNFSALSGLQIRLLGRSARNQSLHRQRYPGSYAIVFYDVSHFSWTC
jgi:hypothetical protein